MKVLFIRYTLLYLDICSLIGTGAVCGQIIFATIMKNVHVAVESIASVPLRHILKIESKSEFSFQIIFISLSRHGSISCFFEPFYRVDCNIDISGTFRSCAQGQDTTYFLDVMFKEQYRRRKKRAQSYSPFPKSYE